MDKVEIPRYSIETISEKFEKLKSTRGKGGIKLLDTCDGTS
jgi:hypothetical protein